jgi:hypothetical protein
MDIFRYLREMARNQSVIKLLNVYKGIPISHDAQISSIGDSEIQVHSNRTQLACFYYQQETYLKGEELPCILRSQVASLNLGKENATLTNLEVASENVGKRSQIRVEPEEPLVALVQFNGASMGLAAPIADISGDGAAVYLEPYMFSPKLCRPGNQVSVSITLPDTVSQRIRRTGEKSPRDTRNPGAYQSDPMSKTGGTVALSTTGEVISVRSEFIRYRVGMRLFFKDLSRTVVLQYISQRQSEIIRDLAKLADELYSRKK